MLFIAYGPESSRLLDGGTYGTGMPDSKGIEVELVVPDGAADAGQKPPVNRAWKWFADFDTIEFETCPVDPAYPARPERVAAATATG